MGLINRFGSWVKDLPSSIITRLSGSSRDGLKQSKSFSPSEHELHVAFTGAQGTGKTTLVEDLVKKHNYPYRNEGAREALAKHGFGDENHSTGIFSYEKTLALQKDIAKHYLATWSTTHCFADRCQVDSLAYAIFWLSREDNQKVEHFFEVLRNHVVDEKGLWDAVILVPPNIPLVADGVRSGKGNYRWHIHHLIQGILEEFGYPYYTLQSSDRELRIAEVDSILDQTVQRYRPIGEV